MAGAAQRGRAGLHLQALVLLTAEYSPKPCACAGGPGVVVWVLKTSLKSEGWSYLGPCTSVTGAEVIIGWVCFGRLILKQRAGNVAAWKSVDSWLISDAFGLFASP